MSTTSWRLFVVGMLGAALVLTGCGEDKPTPRTRTKEKTEGGTAGKTDEASDKTGGSEGWGHLKGRFVLQGAAPKLAPITVSQDPGYCNPFKDQGELRKETVVVDFKNGLKSVVVYLRQKPERIHEDYNKAKITEVVLDNRHCRFEPHVCMLRTSQTLRVKNSDTVGHNTKLDSLSQPFNEQIGAGSSIAKQLTVEERYPVPYSCKVHPWMGGHLVLLSHPYMAVSGGDGTFEIKNLPAGTWEFQLWHEAPGVLDIGDWKGGRAKLAIKDKETNDLGEIKVPVESLKVQ